MLSRALQPNDVFGDYRLERKLGVGGMAEVWLARPLAKDSRFSRVVIKRVHPFLTEDKGLLGLFFDEVRLAQKLDHPNVVSVFDSGRVGDDYFMAMEFIDGLNLRSCLDAHGGPLWPAFAAALVAEACVGLEYAHTLEDEHGQPLQLVHRDIAPDNLMVSRLGRVKLVDFGIARATLTESTTKTGTRKGKIRYMAPEYMREHLADPSTDVYAMGATLFELCTGHRPFDHHRSVASVMNAIVREGLTRADVLRPSLPSELVSIIAAATERDRDKRLRSARALELRLRAFLEEYAPPTFAEIGAEVGLWQERSATEAGVARIKRAAGSYGQLETTELFQLRPTRDPLDEVELDPAAPDSPPSVEVAHPLDVTLVGLSPLRLAPEPDLHDAPTDPRLPAADRLPSVILSPELEALAERDENPSKSGKR